MRDIQFDTQLNVDLNTEIDRLRREIARLHQTNQDLEIALATTTEHGDLVQEELHQTNQRLQSEIKERERAQATLQEIFEKVSQDKDDLELILKATTEHGDTLEYQLYTKAVDTMRQSEELFRALSESTPILMILAQRLDGAIAYANSISSHQLRIDAPEHLIGRHLQDFFAHPEDGDELQRLLDSQGYVNNHEMQVCRTDGSLFWVSASVRRLVLNNEDTLLTTLYDISDRKTAEAALRQSQVALQQQAQDLERRVEQRTAELQQTEAKYRSIFENAAEGIFQSTVEGQYLSVNPALATLYGYDSPEDLIHSITDISHQVYVQPRRRDELSAYLKGFGTVSGFESQVYRRDGSKIWVSENVRVVYDDAGNLLHYEGSVWDITERKNTEAELREQRHVAEKLLLNILPQPVAELLKRHQKTIADSFSDASVMFADLVNFTELSAQTPPKELVELLNDIFSAFDALADRYKLEKIKTIGDAYMMVGGVPRQTVDHLDAMAYAAIAIMREIQKFQTHDGQPLTLRIGIHAGPVVAGVIGRRKFSYDLWGDTVNVASRMEAHGEPGQIQVTEDVYHRLKKRFNFKYRGEIEVKGKGRMKVYWLLNPKSNP